VAFKTLKQSLSKRPQQGAVRRQGRAPCQEQQRCGGRFGRPPKGEPPVAHPRCC